MDQILALFADMMPALTGVGVLAAGIGFLVRQIGWALRERATSKRLAEQAKLERAITEREREHNTGKHLLATSDAMSAYRMHIEKEVADLRAELAQAYIDLDVTRGMLQALRAEFDEYRASSMAQHTTHHIGRGHRD